MNFESGRTSALKVTGINSVISEVNEETIHPSSNEQRHQKGPSTQTANLPDITGGEYQEMPPDGIPLSLDYESASARENYDRNRDQIVPEIQVVSEDKAK